MPVSFNKEIKKDSKLHAFLKQAILARRQLSMKKMSDYHAVWNSTDNLMKAFITEKELDFIKRQRKSNVGEVDYVTIEIPYAFAIVLTFHTYLTSVFMSRTPIYQLSGRHGETQDAIMGMEALMDYQRQVGGHTVPLFVWLYDLAKYGFGVVGYHWVTEETNVARIEEVPKTLAGIPLPGTSKKVKTVQTIKGYEGNKLFGIRPHDFFPDPRHPVFTFQEGEFCGRDTMEGYHSMRAGQSAGRYFNVKDIQPRVKDGFTGGSPEAMESGSSQTQLPYGWSGEASAEFESGPSSVHLHEQFIRLIPSEWQLGTSDRSEMWAFTIANKNTIVEARPFGAYHDKFPFAVQEYGMGSAEFLKKSMAEMIRPLNDIITWLFNSHFYNVRKSLNDTRVVDPSRVMMKDMLTPGAGGVIRLKPVAYGTDPKAVIHQLKIVDMTQTHMRDVQIIEQITQRVSGVVDNVMGIPTQGGRRSATESRINTGFSTNRLKTPAEFNSALGWDPLMRGMISNTLQYYDGEKMYRIAGNVSEGMEPYVNVTPETIMGFYDFIPVNGTMPIDRLAQANFWKELTVNLARSPNLQTQFDLAQMVEYTMKLQGERNVERFRIKANVAMPGQPPGNGENVVPLAEAAGSMDG